METPARFHLLVAASGAKIVGYATYMFQFSPWAGREYMFLDDLYVAEQHRGQGVGACLMRQAAKIAVDREVEIRWHVRRDQQPLSPEILRTPWS